MNQRSAMRTWGRTLVSRMTGQQTPHPEIDDRSRDLLRRALDDPSAQFRDGQWEAIERLTRHRARLLVVQRTGWGKSLVYFLTTRILRDAGAGPALLISPLLALMRNQVEAATRLGIRAATLNSGNRAEWAHVAERLRHDDVDILLVSPERLANDDFRDNLLLPLIERIGFFVIDEAHCISDWGHDFRPDYRRIDRILQVVPAGVPLLATTATANNRVVNDVAETLGRGVQVLRGPLARPGLRLQNIALPRATARMAWMAEQVPHLPGSGIIYALTVRDARRVALWLHSQGIDAHPYWGGLEPERREEMERRLLDNSVKALVATSALGMGFDKPDLGFVIHFQAPGSVVQYYQQVGRAGRAIEQSYGVLLAGSEDRDIAEYFIRTAFPSRDHIEEVLRVLQASREGMSVSMLEGSVSLRSGQIEKVLKHLAVMVPAPVRRQQDRWFANSARYTPNHARVKQLTAIRYQELDRMALYLQSRTCLMRFLARELDDPHPRRCGQCAVCRGTPLLPEQCSRAMVERAAEFVRRNE